MTLQEGSVPSVYATGRSTWQALIAQEEELRGAGTTTNDLDQRVAAVERRVASLLAQSRQVVAAFFDGTLISEETGTCLIAAPPVEGPLPPTAVSRFAEFWRDLLPEAAEQRAQLCIALSRHHAFELDDPDVRLTLGLDDPVVVEAIVSAFGRSPDDLLTEASSRLLARPHGDHAPHSGDIRAEAEADVEWVCIEAGQRLFCQGEQADALYVVVSGRLQAVADDPGQPEQVIAAIEPGELVGEMALITGEPRSATVRAVQLTEMVRLPKRSFDHMLDEHPKSMFPIVRLLVRRLERHKEKLARQVMELTIEIDRAKQSRDVNQIVNTDFFANLTTEAKRLRERRAARGLTSNDA